MEYWSIILFILCYSASREEDLFYQEYFFLFIPELFSVSKFFMIFKAKILNSIYVCVLKSAPEIFKIIMIFDGSFIFPGDFAVFRYYELLNLIIFRGNL